MTTGDKTLAWFSRAEWLGFKEIAWLVTLVVSLVTVTIAVSTYRRNTAIRAQDVEANQVAHTLAAMALYNHEVRALLVQVTAEIDKVLIVSAELGIEGQSQKQIELLLDDAVTELDFVGLMHVLDQFGFMLEYPSYLLITEVLDTMASETSRILLDKRLDELIGRLLQRSSMSGVSRLQWILRVYAQQG